MAESNKDNVDSPLARDGDRAPWDGMNSKCSEASSNSRYNEQGETSIQNHACYC